MRNALHRCTYCHFCTLFGASAVFETLGAFGSAGIMSRGAGNVATGVELGPMTLAAASAPTNAATAVIKPAIAVITPGTECQNPAAGFSSAMTQPPLYPQVVGAMLAGNGFAFNGYARLSP
jgi:hypothetical protein